MTNPKIVDLTINKFKKRHAGLIALGQLDVGSTA